MKQSLFHTSVASHTFVSYKVLVGSGEWRGSGYTGYGSFGCNTERIMARTVWKHILRGAGEGLGWVGLGWIRLLVWGSRRGMQNITQDDPIPTTAGRGRVPLQSPLRLLTHGYRLGQVCWQLENCLLSPLCLRLHLCFFLPHLAGLSEKSQPNTPER